MIGREKERKRLLGAAEDDESRFVAVYGRRRVGKTYLVRETFSRQFAFDHTGSASGTMGDQLAHAVADAWDDLGERARSEAERCPRVVHGFREIAARVRERAVQIV